jgi:hypothetical protein
MNKIILVSFLLISCNPAVIPEECIPYVEEAQAGDSDKGDSGVSIVVIEREPYVSPPCGEPRLQPMCNIRDGSGIFVYTDNCAIYGAMGMTPAELNFFCSTSGL